MMFCLLLILRFYQDNNINVNITHPASKFINQTFEQANFFWAYHINQQQRMGAPNSNKILIKSYVFLHLPLQLLLLKALFKNQFHISIKKAIKAYIISK